MEERKQQRLAGANKASNSILGTCKGAHFISNPCRLTTTAKAHPSPTAIRVIHVFAPEIIKTDAANFRELVQKLTGKPKPLKKLQHPICVDHLPREIKRARLTATGGLVQKGLPWMPTDSCFSNSIINVDNIFASLIQQSDSSGSPESPFHAISSEMIRDYN